MSAADQPYLSRVPECLSELGVPRRSRLASRWTRVHGAPLHSRGSVTGRGGRPFVLIHGLVISSLYMIPLAECLALNAEVHALDLPGFGRSPGPARSLSVAELAGAVIGWLETSEFGACHLMGNSLGCEIAAHVAVKVPQRVATLTMVGPTLDPDAFAVSTQTFRLMRDALHEPARLWLNWAFDFFRAGLPRALGTTREMFRDHIENQLPHLEVPTLIIRGGIDPTLPAAAAQTMKGLVQRSELLVMEGEPHCVHYTEPQRVCAAMLAHAAKAR